MGVPLLEVDLGAGVRAGFTTGDEDFNLSLTLGDDPGAVLARRQRLERWVGAPLAYAWQVHGSDVLVCSGPPDPAQEVVGVADALLSVRDDVGLAVLVADCVPVLLADTEAGVVATAHAGRRGLVAGVVDVVLAAMARYGAEPGRTVAAVGPAACGRCYEVPHRMQLEVEQAVPGAASTTSRGTPGLDLPGAVVRRLTAAGVAVTQVGGCTIEEPRWFSHRASVPAASPGPGRRVGRMAGVVRLLPDR